MYVCVCTLLAIETFQNTFIFKKLIKKWNPFAISWNFASGEKVGWMMYHILVNQT